jgi:hypothetical protein
MNQSKLKRLQEWFKEGISKTETQLPSSEENISKSMGVNTRPSHRMTINGYWILVDSKMPTEEFLKLKKQIEKCKNQN